MNLKQAARRLGIHYQTAYKLVRSGRLAAIRVGGGYEISEAALARYLAEREAVRRVPIDEPPPPGAAIAEDGSSIVDAALTALAATTLSSRAVLDVVSEGLSRVLGDLAVVRPLSREGRWLLPGAVAHPDPRRRSLAATEVDAFPRPSTDGHEGVAIATRAPVFVPHVAQDRVRAQTRPELLQYLDETGTHSLVCAPALHDNEVVAVVTVSRDMPGRPYTRDDVGIVMHVAAVVGAAIARSRAAVEGWQRRHALMTAVAGSPGSVIDVRSVRKQLATEGAAELICDAEGVIVTANAPAGRLGAVTPDALVGTHIEELVLASEPSEKRSLLQRLLVGELTFADTVRTAVGDEGTMRRLGVHLGVVRNAAAEPRALVVVAYPLAEPELYQEADAAIAS